MTPAERQALGREGEVFSRYLLGVPPSSYVVEKYLDAHQKNKGYAPQVWFDRWLLRFATRGPRSARLADSYACLFARSCAFRKKLVLLSAILETSPPFLKAFDTVDAHRPGILFLRLMGSGFGFLAHLLVALALFAPLHLSQAPRAARERSQGS